jgi:hypothetical protein
VKFLNKVIYSNNPLWNEYVHKLPADKQDVYFLSDYHKLHEQNGDGKAVLFVYEEGGDFAIYPFLVNEIEGYDLSEIYYDIQSVYGYSGPLSTTDDKEFINAFEDSFIDYANDNNCVAEFIRFHPLISNHSLFKNSIEVIKDRKTVWIDLKPSLEEIFQHGTSSHCRRDIRLSRKKGLTSCISTYSKNFKELYKTTMTSVRAGEYYFFSDKYFDALEKLPHITTIDIMLEDLTIASGIYLKYDDKMHGHLGGNNKNYSSYTPTTRMMWEAIEYAKSNGYKTLHLGGGSTTNEEDNLLKFKKQFSKNCAVFYIGKRILNKEIYNRLINQWEARHNKKAHLLLEYRTKSEV